jgi:hypothetical protein
MHRRLLAPLYPTTGHETRRTNLDDSDTDPTSPARATATTTSRTAAAAAPVLATLRMQCPCCHATSAVPPSDPTTYPIVDAYGDHALVCTHGNENREKYWHDPLRDQWASLRRMVGLTTRTEVIGLFSFSGKRPDVVLYPPGTVPRRSSATSSLAPASACPLPPTTALRAPRSLDSLRPKECARKKETDATRATSWANVT